MSTGLQGRRVVLTGANGGIGTALARRLAHEGARLLLVGRRAESLSALSEELRGQGADATSMALDLQRPEAIAQLTRRVQMSFGGADILINNAGVTRFGLFETEDPAGAEQLLALNLLVPMRLTRALLPGMLTRRDGQIVNIGSTFGSLAFPGFSIYSASKFGMRGWSEALRRELAGTGVTVSYLSPRATRTAANDDRVNALNARLKTAVDQPEAVAKQLVRAIAARRPRLQLGAGERLFTCINALIPGLVDRALRGKMPAIREHAGRAPAQP